MEFMSLSYKDCFISFKSDDRLRVKLYVDALVSSGLSCWFADEDIGPNSKWTDEIRKGIRYCGVFLLFLSEKSLISGEVAAEISIALELRRSIYIIQIDQEEVNLARLTELGLRNYQVQKLSPDKLEPLISQLQKEKSQRAGLTRVKEFFTEFKSAVTYSPQKEHFELKDIGKIERQLPFVDIWNNYSAVYLVLSQLKKYIPASQSGLKNENDKLLDVAQGYVGNKFENLMKAGDVLFYSTFIANHLDEPERIALYQIEVVEGIALDELRGYILEIQKKRLSTYEDLIDLRKLELLDLEKILEELDNLEKKEITLIDNSSASEADFKKTKLDAQELQKKSKKLQFGLKTWDYIQLLSHNWKKVAHFRFLGALALTSLISLNVPDKQMAFISTASISYVLILFLTWFESMSAHKKLVVMDIVGIEEEYKLIEYKLRETPKDKSQFFKKYDDRKQEMIFKFQADLKTRKAPIATKIDSLKADIARINHIIEKLNNTTQFIKDLEEKYAKSFFSSEHSPFKYLLNDRFLALLLDRNYLHLPRTEFDLIGLSLRKLLDASDLVGHK